jgi:hypothetical protein
VIVAKKKLNYGKISKTGSKEPCDENKRGIKESGLAARAFRPRGRQDERQKARQRIAR